MSGTAFDALQSLLRSTALLSLAGLIVAGLLAALKIRSSTIRWRAWFAVLLCGLGFAPLTLRLPWLSEPATPVASSNVERSETLLATVELHNMELPSEELSTETTAEVETESIAIPPSLVASQTKPLATTPPDQQASSRWPSILLGVWIAGIAAILARGVWRYVRFLHSMRRCTPAPHDWSAEWQAILASQRVKRPVPMLVGEGYGPALCRLPRGYALVVPRAMWQQTSSDARDVILRHELAHYRRNDLVWSLIARWLAAPHWFNPFAHLAVHRLDEASEWACDDAATGGQAARQLILSKTLLGLSETPGAPGAMQAAVGGRSLAMRIRRLLEPTLPKERVLKRVIVAAALLVCLAAGGVRLELVAQESPQTGEAAAPNTIDTVAAKPVGRIVPRESLRFDGKTFDECRSLVQTELSVERLAELVDAVAEFGRRGYEREAADVLVKLLVVHPNLNGLSKQQYALNNQIHVGIERLNPDVTVPPLVDVIQNGNDEARQIAIQECYSMRSRAKAAGPALLDVARNPEASWQRRSQALGCAAMIDHDADALPLVCEELLMSSDTPSDVRETIVNCVWKYKPSDPFLFLEDGLDERLLPLVLRSLDDSDAKVRGTAMNTLARSGPQIAIVLPGLLEPLRRTYDLGNTADPTPENIQSQRDALNYYQVLVEHAGLYSTEPLRKCFADLKGVDRRIVLDILIRVTEYQGDPHELRALNAFFLELAKDADPEIAKSAGKAQQELAPRLKTEVVLERDVFEKLKAAKQSRERAAARRARNNFPQ